MLRYKLVFCDVDEKITLLEMFCFDATLRERFESTHGGCSYWGHGYKNAVRVVGIKMLSKLPEVFDSNSCLGTEFDPDIASFRDGVWLCFGREICVK